MTKAGKPSPHVKASKPKPRAASAAPKGILKRAESWCREHKHTTSLIISIMSLIVSLSALYLTFSRPQQIFIMDESGKPLDVDMSFVGDYVFHDGRLPSIDFSGQVTIINNGSKTIAFDVGKIYLKCPGYGNDIHIGGIETRNLTLKQGEISTRTFNIAAYGRVQPSENCTLIFDIRSERGSIRTFERPVNVTLTD